MLCRQAPQQVLGRGRLEQVPLQQGALVLQRRPQRPSCQEAFAEAGSTGAVVHNCQQCFPGRNSRDQRDVRCVTICLATCSLQQLQFRALGNSQLKGQRKSISHSLLYSSPLAHLVFRLLPSGDTRHLQEECKVFHHRIHKIHFIPQNLKSTHRLKVNLSSEVSKHNSQWFFEEQTLQCIWAKAQQIQKLYCRGRQQEKMAPDKA